MVVVVVVVVVVLVAVVVVVAVVCVMVGCCVCSGLCGLRVSRLTTLRQLHTSAATDHDPTANGSGVTVVVVAVGCCCCRCCRRLEVVVVVVAAAALGVWVVPGVMSLPLSLLWLLLRLWW